MPLPTVITDLSQTAGSNYPAGSDSPNVVDNTLRAHASFIAMLRDGQQFTDPVTLASAATADIGAQTSLMVDISGTTTITSFGTNYNGPRFIRFTGALTLTHNATTLILPGAQNITTTAGDTCIVYPTAAGTGWVVTKYQHGSYSPAPVQMFNWLHNPDGEIYQRAVAASADVTYTADRWYVLTQTNTVTPSQVSNPEDGYAKALRMTQSQAVAQRMGVAQQLEAADVYKLRGKTVTFAMRAKQSTSANIRMAIVAWTGTADSPTKDVVNDWTSATYTTGNFFIATTTTVVATTSTALTAATAAMVSVSGAIPSTATNVCVFYWTEATVAQNVTLDAWGARLTESASVVDYMKRSLYDEYNLCARFLPVFNSTTSSTVAVLNGQCITTSSALVSFTFPTPARIAPTGITLSAAVGGYNTSVANGGASPATAITYNSASLNNCSFTVAPTGAVLVVGDATMFGTNTAAAKILFTGAEL
jgi:hypothetical protein